MRVIPIVFLLFFVSCGGGDDDGRRLGEVIVGTWQRGWGLYDQPFTEPQNNLSLLAEAEYCFCEFSSMPGWGIKASIGLDHGQLLGNNFGGQLTITKRFNLWE